MARKFVIYNDFGIRKQFRTLNGAKRFAESIVDPKMKVYYSNRLIKWVDKELHNVDMDLDDLDIRFKVFNRRYRVASFTIPWIITRVMQIALASVFIYMFIVSMILMGDFIGGTMW